MPSVKSFLRDLPPGLRRVQFLTEGKSPLALTAGLYSPVVGKRRDTLRLSEYRLLYLLEGRGTFAAGGRERTLGPGDLVERLPGMEHTIRRQARLWWTDFYLILPPPFYDPLVECGLLPLRGEPFLLPESGVLRSLQNLLESMKRQRSLAEAFAAVFQVLSLFERSGHAATARSPLQRSMDEACRLLTLEAGFTADLPTLAARLGLGYEHFRKAFRRHTGHAPKEYHIRGKIRRAQELLGAEPLSVGEVSARLGYPDLFTFSKQFRRVTGMTPSQYRKSVW